VREQGVERARFGEAAPGGLVERHPLYGVFDAGERAVAQRRLEGAPGLGAEAAHEPHAEPDGERRGRWRFIGHW
jgi:hypothetical protein